MLERFEDLMEAFSSEQKQYTCYVREIAQLPKQFFT
jgi:hypothetical protein